MRLSCLISTRIRHPKLGDVAQVLQPLRSQRPRLRSENHATCLTGSFCEELGKDHLCETEHSVQEHSRRSRNGSFFSRCVLGRVSSSRERRPYYSRSLAGGVRQETEETPAQGAFHPSLAWNTSPPPTRQPSLRARGGDNGLGSNVPRNPHCRHLCESVL